MMFLLTDNLYEKPIGQVTSGLLYMRLTYKTKDNQAGVSQA